MRPPQIVATLDNVMKTLLIAVLSLGLFSCRPSHSSSTAADSTAPSTETSRGSGDISADPNPARGEGKLGETTIAWDTKGRKSGEVYVSKGDGPEKLFGSGSSGSKKVNWISATAPYEFRLYEGTDHRRLLSKVQVTHKN